MRNKNSSAKSGDVRGAKNSGSAGSGRSTGKGKATGAGSAVGKGKATSGSSTAGKGSFAENRKKVQRIGKGTSTPSDANSPSFTKKRFSNNEQSKVTKPESGKSYSKVKGSFSGSDSKKAAPTDKREGTPFARNSMRKTKETFGDEKTTVKREGTGTPFTRKPLRKTKEIFGDEKTTAKKSDKVVAETGVRLNKFISNSGVCSRREADVFIEQGVVKINGKIVTELGYRVQLGDDVQFDGKHIRPEKPVYLLLNKPKDYLTSMADDRGRKTVMNLIKDACKERVYPVGRLDRNTMGLLLFTNDGELADKLMHPRKSVKKIYMAELSKNLKEEHLDALREGVVLEDGFFKPDVIEYVLEKGKTDKSKIGIEIHSGRNRIVRRMFEHFGYQVVKLDRVMYAGLTKKNILRGKWRLLEEKEIAHLKML